VTRVAGGPDQALLARARRVLGLQTAAAITLSLLIVGTVVVLVVARTQRAAAESSLRQTAATADDVIDPPLGMWIFKEDAAGRLTGTDDAPDVFPDRAALERVRAGGPTETADRGAYLVITRRRGKATVQVVASTHEQMAELRRLLVALGLAELAGLLVALLSAVVLGRRATAPLGEALARQRQFVADASHELRTPLTQLHTRAQLLDRDLRAGAFAADLAEDVGQMVVGTRHLGEVIEDLLLSSQLPDQPRNVAAVDLATVAADVVTSQSARAQAQDVELTTVSGADGPSIVDGREAALRRVITALVDNALSHTPQGGHVTVEVGTERRSRQVTVVVRDDGAGFDPADAERLFARFARGHGDHRRFGLGLALAREVVTGHGGTIEAWGSPGAGAAFTIRLPLH
jgi:two-component system, OmpR family, sensor kinase